MRCEYFRRPHSACLGPSHLLLLNHVVSLLTFVQNAVKPIIQSPELVGTHQLAFWAQVANSSPLSKVLNVTKNSIFVLQAQLRNTAVSNPCKLFESHHHEFLESRHCTQLRIL